MQPWGEYNPWEDHRTYTISVGYVRAAILGLHNITSVRRFYAVEGRFNGMRYLLGDDPILDKFDRIHLLHPDDADYIAEAMDWKPARFN